MPNFASYVTVEESIQMAEMIPQTSGWVDLDESLQLSSLSYSSKMLDSFFDWSGTISTESQQLRWPRKNVYDRDGRLQDSTLIPDVIKQATFLLANNVANVQVNGSTPGNLDSLKIGPISLSFDTTLSISEQPIASDIISMLVGFGTYTGPRNTTDAYNIRALR